VDYDLELVRAILQVFGEPQDGYIDTDGFSLSPPTIVGRDPRSVPRHVDRLLEVGILRQTREIQMKHHPDPVTLRTTEAGREWVRRAWSDRHWEESAPTLQQLLSRENP